MMAQMEKAERKREDMLRERDSKRQIHKDLGRYP